MQGACRQFALLPAETICASGSASCWRLPCFPVWSR